MSIIIDLRKTKARAVEKLGTEEAIHDPILYDEIKKEIFDLDAKIARADEAQRRAAELAIPAGGHAAAESQIGVEGFHAEDVDSENFNLRLARANGLSDFRARGGDQRPGRLLGHLPQHERFPEAISLARKASGHSFADKSKHFRNLGEQLVSVYNYYISRGTNVDARLIRAPAGAGEVDPTGVGFLVQTDFAAAVFMLIHDMGEIASRVNKLTISPNSNGIKIPAVDEVSRATGSRWGGVQAYWADEGTAPTLSKPKTRMVELSLHKLIAASKATDELLADTNAYAQILGAAFPEEMLFLFEDAIFEGSGAGYPLGILPGANGTNAIAGAALSTLPTYGSLTDPAYFIGPTLLIPSEKGQPSGSIVKANIDKMWTRMLPRQRSNAVWLAHPDIQQDLLNLNQPVGTGGVGGTMVYMPEGGMSNEPYAKIYNRPILFTEYNTGRGRPGDLVLADLSQITAIDKGGMQMASSMHVAFLTDEMTFRITYRCDAKPMWTVPQAPFAQPGFYKSAFVALQAR